VIVNGGGVTAEVFCCVKTGVFTTGGKGGGSGTELVGFVVIGVLLVIVMLGANAGEVNFITGERGGLVGGNVIFCDCSNCAITAFATGFTFGCDVITAFATGVMFGCDAITDFATGVMFGCDAITDFATGVMFGCDATTGFN
jgi:hypothetical protein